VVRLETEMAQSLREHPPLVLAFAIEHSGREAHCSIVALGAAVLCQGEVLAQQRWTACTSDVYFEPSYRHAFWFNKSDLLMAFATPGTLKEALQAMAEGFQTFRVGWETEALERDVPLYLVCDEALLTVGAINRILADYTTDPPLPWGAGPRQYHRFWDAYSLCRGWLTQADPTYCGVRVYGRMCDMLKALPIKIPDYTHFPEKEACRIGLMASIALGLVPFVGI